MIGQLVQEIKSYNIFFLICHSHLTWKRREFIHYGCRIAFHGAGWGSFTPNAEDILKVHDCLIKNKIQNNI